MYALACGIIVPLVSAAMTYDVVFGIGSNR